MRNCDKICVESIGGKNHDQLYEKIAIIDALVAP
jgi:hypothetical protein